MNHLVPDTHGDEAASAMLSVEPQSVSNDIPGSGQGWLPGWYTLVHVSTHGLDRKGRYCGKVTQRYSWGAGGAAGDG